MRRALLLAVALALALPAASSAQSQGTPVVGGGSGFGLVIPGLAGLLIGAAGGFLAVRRRRSA